MTLANFRSIFPNYDYYVGHEVSTPEKLDAFHQFLSKFKDDCNFSITSYEPNQTIASVLCTAFSTSSNYIAKIFIALSSDREVNLEERKAIDSEWIKILQISLQLEDKWNGVNYSVYKRLTLNGKKRLLEQFVAKYPSAKFEINSMFGGGTTFKVTANDEDGTHELLIDYLPQREGEAIELEQHFSELSRQVVVSTLTASVFGSEPVAIIQEHELEQPEVPIATAGLHPAIQQAIGLRFFHGFYSDSIQKACTALEKAVQVKSAQPITTVGASVMTTAFSKNNPLLHLAADSNEQFGFMSLYQGAVMALRNHYAHNLTELTDPARALEWLSFISTLFYKLDEV